MNVVRVVGDASYDMPLRVLNLLALLDIAPDRVSIRRDGTSYVLRIHHGDLAGERADLLLEKLRSMVLVTEAGVETGAGHVPDARMKSSASLEVPDDSVRHQGA